VSTLVDYWFAGLWTMVWHWGIGVGLIILLLAAAYFSPLCKKDFVYAAVIVAVAMFFEGVGVHMEAKYRDAKAAVIQKDVDSAVQEKQTPKAEKSKDPWDKPTY
jgi:hypothetical protein